MTEYVEQVTKALRIVADSVDNLILEGVPKLKAEQMRGDSDISVSLQEIKEAIAKDRESIKDAIDRIANEQKEDREGIKDAIGGIAKDLGNVKVSVAYLAKYFRSMKAVYTNLPVPPAFFSASDQEADEEPEGEQPEEPVEPEEEQPEEPEGEQPGEPEEEQSEEPEGEQPEPEPEQPEPESLVWILSRLMCIRLRTNLNMAGKKDPGILILIKDTAPKEAENNFHVIPGDPTFTD